MGGFGDIFGDVFGDIFGGSRSGRSDTAVDRIYAMSLSCRLKRRLAADYGN